jgi:fatty-acyl-CoA synthase
MHHLAGLFGKIAREVRLVSNMVGLLGRIGKIKPDSPHTVADILERWARDRPDNVSIVFEDKTYTYRDLEENARRYAHWARSLGLKRGDVVALLMENRPDYICAWLGMFKVGAQVALINTNLQGAAVRNSAINVPGVAMIILRLRA